MTTPTTKRDDLVRALDSIRPDGTSDVPLAAADVPAVLELAIERVRIAQADMARAIALATERLLTEQAKAHELADLTRALSDAGPDDDEAKPTKPTGDT